MDLQLSMIGEKELKPFVAKVNWNQIDTDASSICKLAPHTVQKMEGWTKNISHMPGIDDSKVKDFLCQSPGDVFTRTGLRAYRKSPPYQLMKAEVLHSVMYHPLPGSHAFCMFAGQCLPSYSLNTENVDWLQVILDKKSGQPYASYCSCKDGSGQACVHVGALLFLLSELVGYGVTMLEDRPRWPKRLYQQATLEDEEPMLIEEVFVESNECLDQVTPVYESLEESTPAYQILPPPPVPSMEMYESVLRLAEDLRAACAHSGVVIPASFALNPESFNPARILHPPEAQVLSDVMAVEDFTVVREEVVPSRP